MQDRAYVIAIVIVLAICCLGGVVAVTGYVNSNPISSTPSTGSLAVTPLVISFNTDTPVPVVTKSSGTGSSGLTSVPAPTPLGAFQTIAASTTTQPPASPTAPVVAKSSSQSIAASPISTTVSCAGFGFCPKIAPADSSLGPGGNECPRNYIWGRVVDLNGRGMANMRVRYQGPSGEYDAVITKAPPDPAGVYNIVTGQTGTTWTIWLIDADGRDLSPHINVVTQAFSGAGDCPTRRDFVQQK
jgi:hypothetical protein